MTSQSAQRAIAVTLDRRDGSGEPTSFAFSYYGWSTISSENRYPPGITSGAGFFGIMLDARACSCSAASARRPEFRKARTGDRFGN